MAEADTFIGSKVSVLLQSGIKLEGTISCVEPSTQLMTLKNVSLLLPGQKPLQAPVYGVYGKDIKDLQVLSAPLQSQQQKQQQQRQREPILDNHLLEDIPPPKPRDESSAKTLETPMRSASASKPIRDNNYKKSKQQTAQYHSQPLYSRKKTFKDSNGNTNNDWAKENVEIFKEEEFDFQKNLNLFDKEKVFAEIREADNTAQEDLLVTINRLPQKNQQYLLQQKRQINLLPTENVLEHDNLKDDDDDDDYFEEDESDNGDSETQDEFMRTTATATTTTKKRMASSNSKNLTARIAKITLASKSNSSGSNSNKNQQQLSSTTIKTTKIVTKNTGIACSTVSPLQMARVEHECSQISDSFDHLVVENGGRGAASLILQLLSRTDIVSPSVNILVGNTKKGALGLAAARHLFNHGCSVTVCIITASSGNRYQQHNSLSDLVRPYYNALSSMKQKIADSNSSNSGRGEGELKITFDFDTDFLTAPDLIVDAMLGVDDNIVDMQGSFYYDEVCNVIEWANRQLKPILSIEFPSGIDAGTGIPLHPEHMIHPKWTLCLGAPLSGCKSLNVTGELYLMDVGIPKICWRKVGMKGNTIPWCADFLVALEYNTTEQPTSALL
ncbi:YjeF N-terminal domain-containing protein [Mycotypha africana]|uniref:YjeF N-terminal domain-containing protein n=1 Tax=Mycotypha africana TaxID=64632 RepID=UPI0022FFDC6A|nr:YjeF N-terminal domain-containing protein [Mycotypha africana]KAI8975468.1 YjeF N-terminal domain-containing protein [Mycotypha africana]